MHDDDEDEDEDVQEDEDDDDEEGKLLLYTMNPSGCGSSWVSSMRSCRRECFFFI